jgi:hypothetical protein
VQYDSSQYRVLTDFLASYEFHRGTVVDAGYDPLIERRDSINGKCVPGSDDYFAKASVDFSSGVLLAQI